MGLFKKHTYDNESPGRLAWRRFRRNIPAMVALGYVMVLSVVALFAYVVIPDKSPDANRMCLQIKTQKPGFSTSFLKVKKEGTKSKGNLLTGFEDEYTYVPVEKATSETVSRSFPLGTDRYGRDMLSRLILGARVSMLVGIIAVLISLIIGVTLGAIAGYFGGWIDSLIQWIINVIWSIPTILLVIAVSIALGKGFMQVFIAVGLTMWVEVARMVRGQVLSLRQMEFVEASKALGFSHWRAIFVHILPNISGPLSVVAASNFASAILIEAGLSFIGFGVQPPTASWGTMIRDHYGYIILDNAYLAVLPGLAIVSVVLAFIMLGNGLRDAMDVKGVADRA